MMERIEAGDELSMSTDGLAENIRKLKELFPELVTEAEGGHAINVDVLKGLVGDRTVTDAQEKYGLNWFGKRQARQLALTPSLGTLRPCKDESVDWDTTKNLMIEGDNLEVLKLLKKSYSGKVKLIYIDPPYNTGNDFVYPDDYRDNIKNYQKLTGQIDGVGRKMSSNTEASGRFHTDWLNMMYPRLILAKELLDGGGLVAISVDENELAHAIDCTDEVFGRENLIGHVSVVNNLKGRSDDAHLATSHESLLMYARNLTKCDINGLPLPAGMRDEYDLEDEFGQYKLIPLKKSGKGWRREDRPNMFYPVYVSSDCTKISHEPFSDSSAVLPMRGNEEGRWRWGKDTFLARHNHDVVARVVRGGGVTVYTKMRLGEDGEERTLKPKSTWIDPKFDSGGGGRELKALGMDEVFANPKPLNFLAEILAIATDSDSTIIDLFGGSGSLGQAVMMRNLLDGGTRRYIGIQLPEPISLEAKEQRISARFCLAADKPLSIAEITKERLRRAGAKLRSENPLFSGDLGFRVFKLDSTNIRAWDPHPTDLTAELQQSLDHLRADRTDDDIAFEFMLKYGIDLSTPIEERTIAGKRVLSIGAGAVLACLDRRISNEDAEAVALGMVEWWKTLRPHEDDKDLKRAALFRDAAFASDATKLNLVEILKHYGPTKVYSL